MLPDRLVESKETVMNQIEVSELSLPARDGNAHKNSCGHVVILGGSQSMSGAAALTGLSALRAGAGLVTVLTSADAQPIVASFSPCLMVVPLPSDFGLITGESRGLIRQYIEKATVVAMGPGLGQSGELRQLTSWLYHDCEKPLVVDADGLNNLSAAGCDLSLHNNERILTPHLGEFRRLTACQQLTIEQARDELGKFASSKSVTCLIKGPRTLVSDGEFSFENSTGNPGMATAGCGDVLTGIVAALVGQGMRSFDATALGVYLHGAAGDLAVEKFGTRSLIATDVIENLPTAINSFALQA